MPARKIIAEHKIVQEKDGRIHNEMRMGFQFTDDEKKSALVVMLSGVATIANNWHMLDYFFEVVRQSEKIMTTPKESDVEGK
jgi:hypothetical protein